MNLGFSIYSLKMSKLDKNESLIWLITGQKWSYIEKILIRKPNLVTSNGYKVFEFLKWRLMTSLSMPSWQKTSILFKSSKKKLFGNRVFRLDRISKCLMRSLKVKFWKRSFEFKREKMRISGQSNLNPNLWLVIKYYKRFGPEVRQVDITSHWK